MSQLIKLLVDELNIKKTKFLLIQIIYDSFHNDDKFNVKYLKTFNSRPEAIVAAKENLVECLQDFFIHPLEDDEKHDIQLLSEFIPKYDFINVEAFNERFTAVNLMEKDKEPDCTQETLLNLPCFDIKIETENFSSPINYKSLLSIDAGGDNKIIYEFQIIEIFA